jgi:branched-chain amino acid transport system substrate-binding protein
MIGRRHVVVFLVLMGAALLASTAAESSSPHRLVLAVEGPQSGSQSSNGLDQLRGVRLAVRQLNAHGGLWDGRKVIVYAADDKGDVAQAKPAARRVVSGGIRFVIGPYNSSVGVANLSLYRRSGVLPLWMTSDDATRGAGATVQPMNSQISPVETSYVKRLGVRKITMLVDDTANGAFTKGVASALQTALRHAGDQVSWISVRETNDNGVKRGYYKHLVSEALATKPDFVYVSTYFPEGVEIAQALEAAGTKPPCLMGLANVDKGFLAKATTAVAQRCVFDGVPAAPQMPTAASYVRNYRAAFGRSPGVWGSFTYDSARILFAAIDRAKSFRFSAVERRLRSTKGFHGATGTIAIAPHTGYRKKVPLSILRVDSRKRFVIAK